MKQFYLIMNATVSHEMKTPLNALIGTSKSLTKSKLTASQANLVHINLACGKQLLSFMNDSTDLYLIESNKFTEKKNKVNYKYAIDDLC